MKTIRMRLGPPDRQSVREEASELVRRGKDFDQAMDEVLAKRRDEARDVIARATARRDQQALKSSGRVARVVPLVARPVAPVKEVKKEVVKPHRDDSKIRERRLELRDLIVNRAAAFAAFVVIAETKGLPAHVIDEGRLATVVVQERWDLIPFVLAWMIREDQEVRNAFRAFSDAAQKCMKNLRTGVSTSRMARQANEIISEQYRDMFLHATSVFARKLATLESSLDHLSTLNLSELEALSGAGDDLSRRVAAIGLRISDEIARRKAIDAANARGKKYDAIAEEARRLARDMVPQSGQWQSRAQAVRSIQEAVLAFAKSREIVLSELQAPTTIDGYLKTMDNADTLFAGKRGR